MDWAEDVNGGFSTRNEASKSITACFIAFWFGYFLGYYAAYFNYGGKMDISSPAFGNIAVLIGSVFTGVTFLLLIIQNYKFKKRQEAADRRQEKLEERQNELWESQQVKIKFEMYQAHKREFFRVLDDIEKSSPMDIEFYNRESLYRRIYPMNNFKHVSLDVEIGNSDKCKAGDLTDINATYLLTVKQLTKIDNYIKDGKERSSAPYSYLNDLLFLSAKLSLAIIPKGDFGDICFNKTVVLNAYNLNATIDTLHHAFKGIMAFVGHSDIDNISHLTGSFYYDAMQEVLFKHPRIKQSYDFNLDETGYAVALYDLYIFFSDSTVRDLDNSLSYLELNALMCDEDKIGKLIINNTKLYELIFSIRTRYFKFMYQLSEADRQHFATISSKFNSLFLKDKSNNFKQINQ